MTKSLSLATSVLVAVTLAAPTVAAAQASRRSGGGSSSGQASPRSSGGEAGSAPAQPSGPAPSSERAGDDNAGTARARGTQPSRGTAQARTNAPRPPGASGPWYAPSYGGYFGYGYNPYGYYGSRAYWAGNGWYDPFLFDPFGYYGYDAFSGPSPYYWTPEMTYSRGDYPRGETWNETRDAKGSVRLKVDPKQAKVYIDGALAGTADDFDGLSDHLTITAGPHQLELRADGYESYQGQIDVRAGQTRTTRINLKKK